MYIRRRRVPLAELCGVCDPTERSGPDSSLKRRLIFIWTRLQHCVDLGTVTHCIMTGEGNDDVINVSWLRSKLGDCKRCWAYCSEAALAIKNNLQPTIF